MKLIQDIIAFCEITGQKPKQIASKRLDNVFGKSALGKQLRRELMVVVNDYYNPETHQCKEYKVNWLVYLKLLQEYTQFVNLNTPLIELSTDAVGFECVSQELEREHGEELTTGKFEYIRKGNRYYHALQNLPKKTREQIFADYGYRWDYDIKTAMPTLIQQYALMKGLDIETPYYNQMLKDPNRIRGQIANDLNISMSQAKILLTSLINGAKVAVSNQHANYAIHELLNHEGNEMGEARMIMINGDKQLRVQPHVWLTGYREDIKVIWSAIKRAGAITRKFKDVNFERINRNTGEIHGIHYTKELPLTSKQKAFLYQMLEYQVMYSVRNYLELNYIKYYQIHDGMMTDKPIDVKELESYIFNETEFQVEFEERVMEQTSDYNRMTCMHMHTRLDTPSAKVQSAKLKALLKDCTKKLV